MPSLRRGLSLPQAFAIVRPVNPLRLLPLLAVLILVTGCQTLTSRSSKFTKLRVTNHRGELVAEWIAKGAVSSTERGYNIRAVERLSGPPYSTLTKYPDGWRTSVVGPHIWRWRCAKPLWLAVLDGDVESATVSRSK